MRWSLNITRVGETQVRVHFTFLLFLVWIAFISARLGGAPAALKGVIFVCLIFFCVLLHEFGHVFAARRYGIQTPEITLLPIGGVARLERMPEKPSQEMFVAICGPAVNLALAFLLWIFILATGGFPDATGPLDMPVKLLGVNLWLVLFNLIPAFPMDGGRILRAALAMRTDYARATQLAATVGQGIAFVFGFLGLIGNPMLLLIAVFVYFGAANEASLAQIKSFTNGLRVSAAMVTRFEHLPLHATLDDAVEVLLRTSQHEFPVLDECERVRGILTRDDLIVALRKSGAQTPVAEVMREGIPTIHPGMLFERAFTLMQENKCPALPVVDTEGQLVGLFTPENVGELIMVRDALAHEPQPSPLDPSSPLFPNRPV